MTEEEKIFDYNDKRNARIRNGQLMNADENKKERLVVIRMLGAGSYGVVMGTFGDGDHRTSVQRMESDGNATLRCDYSALKVFAADVHGRGVKAARREGNNMDTINKKRREQPGQENGTTGGFKHIVAKRGQFVEEIKAGGETRRHYCIEYELMRMTLEEFLRDRWNNVGKIPVHHIIDLWHQLLKGLQSLEQIGFSDTDIKPDNVMVADYDSNAELLARQVVLRMQNRIPMNDSFGDVPSLWNAMTPWFRDPRNPEGYRTNHNWFLEAERTKLLPPALRQYPGNVKEVLKQEYGTLVTSFRNKKRYLWKLNDINDNGLTIGYNPPEDIIETETSTTPGFSVWSMGCTLFTTVAGEPLFPWWDYQKQGSSVVRSSRRVHGGGPHREGSSSDGGDTGGGGTPTAQRLTMKPETGSGFGTNYGLREDAFGSGGVNGPDDRAFVLLGMQHATLECQEMQKSLFNRTETNCFFDYFYAKGKQGSTRSKDVGVLRDQAEGFPSLEERIITRIHHFVDFSGKNQEQQNEIIVAFTSILKEMLALNPKERAAPAQLLESRMLLLVPPYTEEGQPPPFSIASVHYNEDTEVTTLRFNTHKDFKMWAAYHNAFTDKARKEKGTTHYYECKNKGCPRNMIVTFEGERVQAVLTSKHCHYAAYNDTTIDAVKRNYILQLMNQYDSVDLVVARFRQIYKEVPESKIRSFWAYWRYKHGLPIH